MKKEISKSDINKMNKIIFKKINEQFDKDLTPSEFIATSRLALAFQKTIKVNEGTERDEKEIYENIMSVLDRAGMRIAENESDDNDNL